MQRPRPQANPAGAADPAAFDIGLAHARQGCVPPPEHLHPLSPVRTGWEYGRAAFGSRTLRTSRHTQLWLNLRLQAWQRGVAFDPLHINPALLARIEVPLCPVTRVALAPGSGGDDDLAVLPVDAGAGYLPGNLAVLSALAQRALAGVGAAAALDFARRIDAGGASTLRGLDAAAWRRAAVLLSFATPLDHALAAALPLALLPPPRLAVRNPVQALQLLLTLQVTRAGHPRRCAGLAASMPDAETRHAFHAFMHTLLARRLACGRCSAAAERDAVEALAFDPLLQQRWQRLALRLSEADCAYLVRLALDRGLAGPALQAAPASACDDPGWTVPGHRPADAQPATPQRAHPATAATRPISTRQPRAAPASQGRGPSPLA